MKDVLAVEELRGSAAAPGVVPSLLVEVPHGADRRAHYDAWRARLQGPLPEGLHAFFHVNTDVGAWQLGLAVARAYLALHPERSVRAMRCLMPRTFVDTNRVLDGQTTDGMTRGLPTYITDPVDQALLVDAHQRYVGAVTAAVEEICGAGGVGFFPHTYAPREVGIASVGPDIVERLFEVYAPGLVETWPLRAEVDVIGTTAEGEDLTLTDAPAKLRDGLAERGLTVVRDGAYYMHPSSQSYTHARRHPGRTLCLEVRRDLVVQAWTPFEEMDVDGQAISGIAEVIAAVL